MKHILQKYDCSLPATFQPLIFFLSASQVSYGSFHVLAAAVPADTCMRDSGHQLRGPSTCWSQRGTPSWGGVEGARHEEGALGVTVRVRVCDWRNGKFQKFSSLLCVQFQLLEKLGRNFCKRGHWRMVMAFLSCWWNNWNITSIFQNIGIVKSFFHMINIIKSFWHYKLFKLLLNFAHVKIYTKSSHGLQTKHSDQYSGVRRLEMCKKLIECFSSMLIFLNIHWWCRLTSVYSINGYFG